MSWQDILRNNKVGIGKEICNSELAFGYFDVALNALARREFNFPLRSFYQRKYKNFENKEILSFHKQDFVASNNGFTLSSFYEYFMFTEFDVRKYNFKRKLPHKFVCTSVPTMQVLEGH